VTAIFARSALLPDGWRSKVRVVLDGRFVASVTANAQPQPADCRVDTLLPALSNLHSHSFQRAMAGMTETRGASGDSFWTWRVLMYRFLDHLAPEDIEAIAALAFMEMQESGFAAVAEFHYLHHQPGGAPYADLAELSKRIIAAAQQTGIGLTLLPVLYSFGGLDKRALQSGQLRFGNDLDRFLRLAGEAGAALKSLPADTQLGLAPHSLRAASPGSIKALAEQPGTHPLHMHIAEQPGEIAEVMAELRQRPVEWLLDSVPLSDRWCLVHATHMTSTETRALARSGATVSLCPITEASLGDGAFNAPDFLAANGRFGIGTDSNIRISAHQELRTLEYSQRQRDLARNVLAMDEGSVGEQLYRGALKGGAAALGRDAGSVAAGKLADLIALDGEAPALCALEPAQILDGWIFAGSDGLVTDLWSAGRHAVREGRHVARDAIAAAYRSTMKRLMDKIR
jgi:formimidoylglutamate deiminase